MNPTGRPIRFLVSVVGGWTLLRVAMLWHETGSLPQAIREIVPLPRIAHAEPLRRPVSLGLAPAVAGVSFRPSAFAAPTVSTPPSPPPAHSPGPSPMQPDPVRIQFAIAMLARVGPGLHVPPLNSSAEIVPARATTPFPSPSRWAASAWLVSRGGNGLGSAPGSQLGGSQAGLRIDRALGRGFALTARATAPLQGRGSEFAAGVAWQPARLPLRLVAEHRFAIDGGRGGPSLGVSGGVSDARLPAHFRLEAYAQAGAVARDGIDGYADGALRVTRTLAQIGRGQLDLGGGAWGAKQRGAARLDVGPTATLRLPLADGGARLQLDWRQRIAGSARPGSGPALTFGADF